MYERLTKIISQSKIVSLFAKNYLNKNTHGVGISELS